MAESKLPAFFEVVKNGKPVLAPAEQCLEDTELRRQVVRKAFATLDAWQSQYAGFFRRMGHEPCGQFVEALERLKTQTCDDWPMHSDELYFGSHGD